MFITTSKFTADAHDYVARVTQEKIVLIDGERLAGLMIDFNIGVSVVETYTVKKLDPEFFDED